MQNINRKNTLSLNMRVHPKTAIRRQNDANYLQKNIQFLEENVISNKDINRDSENHNIFDQKLALSFEQETFDERLILKNIDSLP